MNYTKGKKRGRVDPFTKTSKDEYDRGRCEVCGQYTFHSDTRGMLDICEICFWQDDGFHKNPNEPCDGPNHNMTTNQARKNFKKLGRYRRF